MDYNQKSLELHKKHQGKLEVVSKISILNKQDLSTAYSPGVAAPCLEIKKDETTYKTYTSAASTVAVISDGSAVLGLGNIGAKASMPVMEGKAVLFKEFGNVNAFPIVIDTQDTEEFIQSVKNIAPSFGGINLEDISAPRCFEIEKRLKEELSIPVFHDDQHGTAIVTLAGIINYLKLSNKQKQECRVVICGSGAAGVAIGKLLYNYGMKNLIFTDSKGAISRKRNDLNQSKQALLEFSNKEDEQGTIKEIIKQTDIFIGVSQGGLLQKEDIETMAKNPAIFAMANPIPEIFPDEAKKGGALVTATGRSDYPNQINNVLVFPGIFKGALKQNINEITENMKLKAAEALANLVEPTPDNIIPDPFDKKVAKTVANSIIKDNL